MFGIRRLLFSSYANRRFEFERLRRRGRLVLGENSYGLPIIDAFDGDDTRLIIGKYCSVASSARFVLGGAHPTDRVTTFPLRRRLGLDPADDGYPYSAGDIVLGNDVWIASGAIILSGVTIGNGCVVASGAVVTRDIPDYAVVAGVPAKPLRFRFTPEQRERLSAIAWWDWPEATVRSRVGALSSANIDEFLRDFGPRS
ncbi:CatB-related O-acetyltransferase [Cellulomonas sp. PSBB021]|uniref:CatB-related O-acetyltransferase n=1 Tax=Cellulomonas sp. PSBB021 TaxID=2003551 RepID=UPI000B8DA7F5|nr:CatB-related O-acetyltransferase [Cellulomonas sp. PSBB021]ASR56428.1 hypothetical protein CBP52_16465 [Cellulomonas sp. PSBB021]